MCENIANRTLSSCPVSTEGEEQAGSEGRVIAPPKVPGDNWAQSGSGSQNKRYKIPFPWSKGEAAVTVLISCSEFIPPLFLQCNNTMHFNQSK